MRTRLPWIGLVMLELGLAVTLASGFYEQNLSKPGRFELGYGLPFAWHGRVWAAFSIAPTAHWVALDAFLLDTVVWSLVFACCVLVWLQLTTDRRAFKLVEPVCSRSPAPDLGTTADSPSLVSCYRPCKGDAHNLYLTTRGGSKSRSGA